MTTWHERFRTARIAANISQTELAEKIKIQRTAITQWESKVTREPAAFCFLKACLIIGADPYLIMGILSTQAGSTMQTENDKGKIIALDFHTLELSIFGRIVTTKDSPHWLEIKQALDVALN